MLKRTSLPALTIVGALLLVACGDQEPSPPPEQGKAPPRGEEAAPASRKTAEELADETERLTGDVAETARTLTDPAAREDAVVRLDEQRQRALVLVEEAQRLPETERARARLVEANRSLADAASRLRDFARSEDASALAMGRSALEEVEEELGLVARELSNRLTPEFRKRLEQLRQRIPEEIPRP
ncbi:MAG: hypothetical protein M3133_06710 [Actinomycetota bacterium]|nr:hypothetical protein [Actinomycetota bacterium]